MSVVRLTRVEEYWTKHGEWPKHCILKFMGFNRFSNIKRFFHVAPFLQGNLPMTRYYKKIEFVASMIKTKFQAVMTTATIVSIDELIVQFTGRSKHTIMTRGKPCPVGYNVLALCEAGYCYGFLFSSPVTRLFKLPSPAVQVTQLATRRHYLPDSTITSMINSLSKTSRAVLHLMAELPGDYFFTLYCNNLFSNANLFHIF